MLDAVVADGFAPGAFEAQAHVRSHLPARSRPHDPEALAGDPERGIGSHHATVARHTEAVAELRMHTPRRPACRQRSSGDARFP